MASRSTARSASDALAAYREASRLQPDWAIPRYNIGMILYALGDREGALEEYRTLRSFDPQLASNLYGEIYKAYIINAKRSA